MTGAGGEGRRKREEGRWKKEDGKGRARVPNAPPGR